MNKERNREEGRGRRERETDKQIDGQTVRHTETDTKRV